MPKKNFEKHAEPNHLAGMTGSSSENAGSEHVPQSRVDAEKAASLERLGEATQTLAAKLAQKEAEREAGLDEPRYFWNRKKSTEDQAGNLGMLGTASTIGLHMVSGPIAGGGLGWLVDYWLNSAPLGLGIGIILGLAAGFRNVWADAQHLIKGQNDASKNSPSSRKD